MPRPPLKKTRTVAKAQREGELKAQTEHEAKTFTNKKQFTVWIKRILEKNITGIPKIVAIIGTMFLVHHLIMTVAELRAKFDILFAVGVPPWMLMLTPHLALVVPFLPTEVKEKDLKAHAMEWLFSFCIAYIIVEHGGQIAIGLGEAFGSLSKMVGFFLA